ncbi:hypothetical protein [Nostoc sp.]|uniref:hypothetical protein n=1 Tax=Nostoc sp. TaxID=1180 RepID=UPI002FFCF997
MPTVLASLRIIPYAHHLEPGVYSLHYLVRSKQKIAQTNPSDGTFPAYIIIIEFSRPLSFLVEK